MELFQVMLACVAAMTCSRPFSPEAARAFMFPSSRDLKGS